jgi:hypothetical protein
MTDVKPKLKRGAPVRERFMSHVQEDLESGCWLWTGARIWSGYGLFTVGKGQLRRVHRLAYEWFIGPIPDGLDVEHACHTRDETCRGRGQSCPHRACVNPTHLEAITHHENLLRGDTIPARHAAKTHCPQGHPYAGSNLYITPRGGRACKTCQRANNKIYKQRERKDAADG